MIHPFLFGLAFYDKESPTNIGHLGRDAKRFQNEFFTIPNKGCKAPHTKKVGGKCVCEPGFPYGNPEVLAGCFRCNEDCPDYSNCSYPGKCRCIPGYSDEETSSCVPKAPELLSIQPEFAQFFSSIALNVTFKTDPGASFPIGYLKFKNQIVKCKGNGVNQYNCSINQVGLPGAFEVSISFDQKSWSKEIVELTVIGFDLANLILGSFLLLVGITIIVGIIRIRKATKRAGITEVPFIQKQIQAFK
ncbi:hypothetical protein TVAG_057330 [Trichomonas vaginalis G3]|uniref:Uncharacterized protein n=1 Tax=Trichomonas vaginalis (strain ATCC PRA-98 / G3) TaxID=412133 RepID=A2F8L1_TRIV3|nr:hypothetical protein TVAGG3_0084630 [Trichomonas vaginalis G3]EAX98743.1 hypothetical protein TVAG_057330 [Trichomonas vaginalis G3]KAI5543507.1 hypothetical protein TVAGG3_0084630 [Trichomonas vaginalis G3]|eukprot:XP_001311673.1 hypothetical protein [Trichomonas vaginalis G3]